MVTFLMCEGRFGLAVSNRNGPWVADRAEPKALEPGVRADRGRARRFQVPTGQAEGTERRSSQGRSGFGDTGQCKRPPSRFLSGAPFAFAVGVARCDFFPENEFELSVTSTCGPVALFLYCLKVCCTGGELAAETRVAARGLRIVSSRGMNRQGHRAGR
jgi:hypothetical protein